MKVLITNHIQIDGETDLVTEQHDCQLTKKGGYDYLVYQNDDKEKVVIKFSPSEMLMTRFSTPNTIMRFQKDGLGLATIPTPMGLQKLLTRTRYFEADMANSCLKMTYDLLTSEEENSVLASYDLSVELVLD